MLITEYDIKQMVTKSVSKILLENYIYTYSFKCVDFDDAEQIQDITGFDPQFSNNIYCISDYLLEDGTIKILDKKEFEILTNNFNCKELTKYPITYYAINTKYNIVFAYCEKNDIHYFFE